MGKRDLLLRGMQGYGDCVHQRGLVRDLKARWRVHLETSAPWVYHDLYDDDFRVILPERETRLWTQAENRKREAARYAPRLKEYTSALQVWYRPDDVRRLGSVFAAMCLSTGTDAATADFRMPVPALWREAAAAWCREHGWNGRDPILATRPLIERPGDWTGCCARNPDFAAYNALYLAIREKFFVVSVAKLKPNVEWQVGHAYAADAIAHHGELTFEMIAGLVDLATLCYGSPGYLIPLSQAVSRPVACVFGGYENGASFSAGSRFAPYLPIEPIEPCNCFRHDHGCRKAIDVPVMRARLIEFAHVAIADRSATR